MNATHIRVVWQDDDGTIQHEDLQLTQDNDALDVISIETIIKGEG